VLSQATRRPKQSRPNFRFYFSLPISTLKRLAAKKTDFLEPNSRKSLHFSSLPSSILKRLARFFSLSEAVAAAGRIRALPDAITSTRDERESGEMTEEKNRVGVKGKERKKKLIETCPGKRRRKYL
jgi:hypothetical protein